MQGRGRTPASTAAFDTAEWAGRYIQGWQECFERLGRGRIKARLLGRAFGNDADVRSALMARFGGESAAVGSRARRGPLYGVTSHKLSALAVAVAYSEQTTQLAKSRSELLFT